MRSKLFVPGSRPELFAKALAGEREAAALALADARVMGLQVGLGDLFEPLGMARREAAAVQQVLFAVRMAAGEAGVDAYDGAFAEG